MTVGRKEGHSVSPFYFPTLFRVSPAELLEFARRRENLKLVDLTKVKANINSELGAMNCAISGAGGRLTLIATTAIF